MPSRNRPSRRRPPLRLKRLLLRPNRRPRQKPAPRQQLIPPRLAAQRTAQPAQPPRRAAAPQVARLSPEQRAPLANLARQVQPRREPARPVPPAQRRERLALALPPRAEQPAQL